MRSVMATERNPKESRIDIRSDAAEGRATSHQRTVAIATRSCPAPPYLVLRRLLFVNLTPNFLPYSSNTNISRLYFNLDHQFLGRCIIDVILGCILNLLHSFLSHRQFLHKLAASICDLGRQWQVRCLTLQHLEAIDVVMESLEIRSCVLLELGTIPVGSPPPPGSPPAAAPALELPPKEGTCTPDALELLNLLMNAFILCGVFQFGFGVLKLFCFTYSSVFAFVLGVSKFMFHLLKFVRVRGRCLQASVPLIKVCSHSCSVSSKCSDTLSQVCLHSCSV